MAIDIRKNINEKDFLAILLLAAATPWGGAVETASGKLSTVIGEDAVSVTELSLTGTMDARDFKYISDSMPQLSVLDISGVTIEEYSDREPCLPILHIIQQTSCLNIR